MSTIRFFKASTIAALAAILFAACGSSDVDAADNAPSSNESDAQPAEVSDDAVVFDFTEQAVRAMPTEGVQEITFKIHPELASANQEYSDQRVLDSVTVSSWDGGESQCGIELRYEYATGAKEEIDSKTFHHSAGELPTNDDERDVKYIRALGGSAGVSANRSAIPSEEYTLLQQERECATGPADDNNSAQGSVEFRSIQWVDTADLKQNLTGEQLGIEGNYTLENETFAEADINVMANGDLHIADYTIHGWTQDANGDWIQSQ